MFHDLVDTELDRATAKFGPIKPPHEGLAVIWEEFEELKSEMFWGEKDKAIVELIQLAAMCKRSYQDCYSEYVVDIYNRYKNS